MQRHDSGGDGASKTFGLGVIGGAGASLALSLCLLSGCANSSKSDSSVHLQKQYLQDLDGSEGLDSQTRLEVLAEREALEPSDPARGIANRILGGQLAELRAGSSAYGRAHRSIEQVLEDMLGNKYKRPIVTGSDPVRSDNADEKPLIPQLAKGYVRARSAMLQGDHAQAIAIYEQLIIAAPDSTDVLIGLGDAYMKSGNRVQAADAYLRAVKLGDSTTRALVYSAMGVSADPEQVINLSGRVWADEQTDDEAGRLLSGIMLGQALIETGSYRAGAEVMIDAVAMLDGPAARDPRYRRELVQLYSKRAEQLATAGDAWLVLDQPNRAMDAYNKAGAIVNNEPTELLRRRVATHLLNGHSALSAMTLLEWIEANPGNDSTDIQDLVASIGEHPLAGSMVVGSLSEYVSDQTVTVSRRRSVLGMLLGLGERGIGDPIALIAQADPEVVSAVACQRMLAGLEDRGSRIEASLQIIRESPSITPTLSNSLIRIDGHPAELLWQLAARPLWTDASRLLSSMISLEIQRPIELGDPIESADGSATWMITRGRTALMAGDAEDAARSIDRAVALESQLNLQDRGVLVDTLIGMGRIDQAVEIARTATQQEPDNASGWLLLGKKLVQASEPLSALDMLSKAIDLDPHDEEIYEQLILIRGSTGPAADVEALRTLTRSLGQRLPDSAITGLIRSHELAGAAGGEASGGEARDGQQAMALLSQAERTLIATHAQHPWREIGTDLLLSVWATQHTGGDPEAIVRGLDWLEGQLAKMPGSVDLEGARARLMVLAGDQAGAEAILAAMYERYPSRAVGRLHEGLIRSDDSRRQEADTLALTRLEGLVSPSDCIERLERASALGKADEFDADLLVPLHESWWYRAGDQLRIVRVLGGLAQTNPSDEINELVLELIDRTRVHASRDQSSGEGAAVDMELALNQIELLALAQSESFTMDSYEALLRRSLADAGGGRDGLMNVAVQSLMRGQSLGLAIELQSRLVVDDDGMLVPQRALDLFGTIGQAGSVEDLKNATDAIDRAGLLIEARDAVVGGMGTINEISRAPADDLIGVRADLMYTAGVLASFYERDSEGRAMYRAILEIDPDHAWANNDLGYKMVEDGDNLVEAERLLLKAHEAEPDASSITDSLAWARYAMGLFDDELDPQGNLVRRGAKGLLADALSSEDGRENATISDHLGDTLWMLEEFEDAINAWLDAEDQIRERLTGLANQTNANQTIITSMREELETIRQKIADGEAVDGSGRVPSVAPNTAGIPVPNRDDAGGSDSIDNTVDPTK